MISSVTSPSNTVVDWLCDHLITLREGDEAIHIMTGEVVTRYSGLVGYLIPTGGGVGESQFKIDILRPVEDLIDGNKLPGIWALRPKLSIYRQERPRYCD